MAELKTKQTEASVEEYLDTIEDPRRRADCAAISALMKRVTKFEPKMWGPSIVGFGSYHYRYKTGHEGDACLAGFSFRRPEIVVYIAQGFESREELLQQTEFVHEFERGRMDRVAAKVAQEIPVLFQHHDLDPGARE